MLSECQEVGSDLTPALFPQARQEVNLAILLQLLWG